MLVTQSLSVESVQGSYHCQVSHAVWRNCCGNEICIAVVESYCYMEIPILLYREYIHETFEVAHAGITLHLHAELGSCSEEVFHFVCHIVESASLYILWQVFCYFNAERRVEMDVWHPGATQTELCPFAHRKGNIEAQTAGTYCSCHINVVKPFPVTNALCGKEFMELALCHSGRGRKHHA